MLDNASYAYNLCAYNVVSKEVNMDFLPFNCELIFVYANKQSSRQNTYSLHKR